MPTRASIPGDDGSNQLFGPFRQCPTRLLTEPPPTHILGRGPGVKHLKQAFESFPGEDSRDWSTAATLGDG